MTLFGDLPESEATGRIAQNYGEIRHFGAVPYVSSQGKRHSTTFTRHFCAPAPPTWRLPASCSTCWMATPLDGAVLVEGDAVWSPRSPLVAVPAFPNAVPPSAPSCR